MARRSTAPRAPGLTLASMVLGLACGGAEPSVPTADPTQTIREYFAAVEAADCDRLRDTLTSEARTRFDEAGCHAVLDDYQEHGAKMLSTEAARADGRDAKRRLVSVHMQVGGSRQTIVVGLHAVQGGWKIDQI